MFHCNREREQLRSGTISIRLARVTIRQDMQHVQYLLAASGVCTYIKTSQLIFLNLHFIHILFSSLQQMASRTESGIRSAMQSLSGCTIGGMGVRKQINNRLTYIKQYTKLNKQTHYPKFELNLIKLLRLCGRKNH